MRVSPVLSATSALFGPPVSTCAHKNLLLSDVKFKKLLGMGVGAGGGLRCARGRAGWLFSALSSFAHDCTSLMGSPRASSGPVFFKSAMAWQG